MKRLFLLILTALVSFSLFAQSSTFDERYSNALRYYESHKYTRAIELLNSLIKVRGITPDQKKKVIYLKEKCGNALKAEKVFVIDGDSIDADFQGGTFGFKVTSGKNWSVSESPTWCMSSTTNDSLYVTVSRNEVTNPRQGKVVITNKATTQIVFISQDARPEAMRTVRISTVPERARVILDGKSLSTSPCDFVLGAGSHTLRFEKSGYDTKDTTLTVQNVLSDIPVDLKTRLNPIFGTVRLKVVPEEGFDFDSAPEVKINGRRVDLESGFINDFDADESLMPYSVYKDGYIPIMPGTVTVAVSALGFKSESTSMKVSRGTNTDVDFTMKAICGTLSVNGNDASVGAEILVDGKRVGVMPSGKIRIKVGEHKISFRKEGSDTEEPFYAVNIRENLDTLLGVTMKTFGLYRFVSEPDMANVILDGRLMGVTPLDLKLLDGEHTVKIEKEGYDSYETNIVTDLTSGVHEVNVPMEKSYQFRITSDEENTYATVIGEKKTYIKDEHLPYTLKLPFSETPYKLVVRHSDNKLAFRKNIKFNSKTKDHYNVKTWSRYNVQAFGGNYYLNEISLFDDAAFKSYRYVADASLLKFKFFNGFSTSVVKGSLYLADDKDAALNIPEEGDKKALSLTGNDNVNMLFFLAPLFLNGEFRVGGGLTDFIDAGLVAGYAWSPRLCFVGEYSHLSGTDIFVGAEVCSRLHSINFNLKCGVQIFKGEANYYRKGQSGSGNNDSDWYHKSIDRSQFVVSVGFTLGGKDSKGNNYLRVF